MKKKWRVDSGEWRVWTLGVLAGWLCMVVAQADPLVMPLKTYQFERDLLGNSATVEQFRSNAVVETRRVINLRDIAPATGTNDWATLNTALGMLSPASGGVIYAGEGTWAFANVITQQNVTIRGMSHINDNAGSPALTNYCKPATNGLPVIQFGNDTGWVKGWALEDLSIYGSSVGSIGVYCAGGAFEGRVDNVAVQRFTNNWKFQSGTSYPCSKIVLDHVTGQPANVAGARGFLFLQAANYPTAWTTEIVLNNSEMDGPASNGYAFEIDSVEVKMVNCYFDVTHNHGGKMTHSFTPAPWLNPVNLNIDGGGTGTNIVFESYNTNRFFFDQVTGLNFLLNGLWKPAAGSLLTPAQSILRQNTMMGYPNVYGSINIINDTGGDFVGGNYTNNQIYAAGGVLFVTAQLAMKVDSGLGLFQVNAAPSTAVATLRLKDTLNNRNADVAVNAGALQMIPAAGQKFEVRSSGGTLWLSVAEATGDVAVNKTITAAGTTGARTIDKTAGRVNFAAAAQTLVVTDALVTTSSVIIATVKTDDATATTVKVSAQSAGSFTLKLNAAATAETAVDFVVLN